jgi:nitrate reductase cytochrome c-type subunit
MGEFQSTSQTPAAAVRTRNKAIQCHRTGSAAMTIAAQLKPVHFVKGERQEDGGMPPADFSFV